MTTTDTKFQIDEIEPPQIEGNRKNIDYIVIRDNNINTCR